MGCHNKPTMAKKKREETPVPLPVTAKSKDRHKNNRFMVRLDEQIHALMVELARSQDRPLTRQVRQACVEHLRAHGLWPPVAKE